MPTWREFSRQVFRCGLYEAQDVLASTDRVDMIAMQPGPRFRVRERWLNGVLHRDPFHLFGTTNPGLREVRLDADYELLLVFCSGFEDLLYVNALTNRKDRCRVSACWIDELWAAAIPGYRHLLPVFEQFDHVFVSQQAAATVLTRELKRPCHWLPSAVDTLRFTPYPDVPAKTVDVYSVGRRREGLHRELRRLAATGQLHYVYDTFKASLADVYDPQQHRDLLASVAKRSRYFLVAPPKFDAPGETAGEVEVGYRYYEGAAAGAVLLGEMANCESFEVLFKWPDVVIEIQADGSDVKETLAALAADPDRVEAVGRRNAIEALRRHDWVYRWHTLLDRVGLSIEPEMRARENCLWNLAARFDIGPSALGLAYPRSNT